MALKVPASVQTAQQNVAAGNLRAIVRNNLQFLLARLEAKRVAVMRISKTTITALLFLLPALAGPACAAQTLSRIGLVLEGAYQQVGTTRIYDGSYRRLSFPGGDIPLERGVCSDVLVRAYRHAGLDLQVLVNQDMSRSFLSYPQLWGLSKPDPNIDHRRVPNLAEFFRRNGTTLPVSTRAGDYTAGDIVTWRLASGVPHIGLVSDRSQSGRPLMIHNIGAGAQVEDVLFTNVITGHYRYDP